MKRFISFTLSIIMIICSVISVDLSAYAIDGSSKSNEEAVEQSIIASTAEEMKCVPTYVKKDGKVHMLYNPFAAEVASDISEAVYKLKDDKITFLNHMKKVYRCNQEYLFEDKELQLGTINSKDEIDGVEQITTKTAFTSLNAYVGLSELTINKEKRYNIIVAFRGTNDFGDILTDLGFVSAFNGGYHSGFLGVANTLINESSHVYFNIDGINVSLKSIINDMKSENSKFSMFVTGHSLGGAVANCFVGKSLYDIGVNPSNVVSYTFAAAQSVQKNKYSYPYDNIFNFINYDDAVPRLGASFGIQIGRNIIYYADDDFKNQHFSQGLNVKDNILSWHSMSEVYANIVPIVNDNLFDYIDEYSTTELSSIDSSVSFNKNTYNRYKNLTIYGLNKSSSGDLVVDGDCYIDDNLSINCNLSVGKQLTLGGNNVHFNGNCALGVNSNVPINIPEGTIYDFNGDLSLYCSVSANKSSYGKICASGNIFGHNSNKLYANVILDGNEKQTLSSFNVSELEFANTSSDGVTLKGTINVEKYVKSTNCIINNPKNLNLHGTIKGNYYNNAITLSSKSYIDHNVVIDGDVTTYQGYDSVTIEPNSVLTINGNLSNNALTIKGKIVVNGNMSTISALYLQKDSILDVNGNFEGPLATTDNLTEGKIYVSGDFYSKNFKFAGNNVVILDGLSKQNLYSSSLCNLSIENESSDGVIINDTTSITGYISSSKNATIKNSSKFALKGGRVRGYYNGTLSFDYAQQTENATINGSVYTLNNNDNHISNISSNSTLNINGNLIYPEKHKYLSEVLVSEGSTLNVNNISISNCNGYGCTCLDVYGNVNVKNDLDVYSFSEFNIHKNGVLSVNGDLWFAPEFGRLTISQGKLAVGGNIQAHTDTYNNTLLEMTGDSILELNGNGTQKIDIEKVANLEITNTSGSAINISRECRVSGTITQKQGSRISAGYNLFLTSTGKINGTYTGSLTFYGAIISNSPTINGTVYIHEPDSSSRYLNNKIKSGACLTVNGSIYSEDHYSDTELQVEKDAVLNVNGSYDIPGCGYPCRDTCRCLVNNGTINISKSFSFGTTVEPVFGSTSVLNVGGSFRRTGLSDPIGPKPLTNFNTGKFYIGGDIVTYYTDEHNSNNSKHTVIFSGDSVVVLNGTTEQTVDVGAYSTLILENPVGTTFKNLINVKTLFNHNGNPFKLSFPTSFNFFNDYNDDGIRDNVDPEPTKVHYFDLINTIEPTCNSKGTNYYICSDCGSEKTTSIDKLNGKALSNELEKANALLNKLCYTESSIDFLRSCILKHENAMDELHSQADVDAAQNEISEAISNLEVKESYSGVGNNGEIWVWNKSDCSLTISGNGNMANYTASNLPWNDFKEFTKKVIINDGITKVGDYSFNSFSTIKEIEFGQDVEAIGKYAFGYVSNLNELIIPDNVKKIEYAAFEFCTSLNHVSVPASAQYGAYAFNNDKAITNIDISFGIDGILPKCSVDNELASGFNKNLTGVFGPWKYADTAIVNIQDGITTIGDNTFDSSKSIVAITIPLSVTNVNNNAFNNCTNLKTVYYFGTPTEWRNIQIEANNTPLTEANIIYREFGSSHIHYFNVDRINYLTCTHEGELLYTCTSCGLSYTEYEYEKKTNLTSANSGVYMYDCDEKRINTDSNSGYISVCYDGDDVNFTMAYYKFDVSDFVKTATEVKSAPLTISLKGAPQEDSQGLAFFYVGNENADNFDTTKIATTNPYIFGEQNIHLDKAKEYFDLHEIEHFNYNSSTWVDGYTLTVDISAAINEAIADHKENVVIMIAQPNVGLISNEAGKRGGWSDTNIKYGNVSVDVEYLDEDNHEYVVDEESAIPATCVTEGKNADRICKDCGYIKQGEKVTLLNPMNLSTSSKGVYMYDCNESRINADDTNGYITICNDGEDVNFTMAYYKFDITEITNNKKKVESAPLTISLANAAQEDCQGLSFFYTGNNIADEFNSSKITSTNQSVFGENNIHIEKAKTYFDLHEIDTFQYNSNNWISDYSITIDIAEAINKSVTQGRKYVVIMISQPQVGQISNTAGVRGGWSDVNIKYNIDSINVTFVNEHTYDCIYEPSTPNTRGKNGYKCLRCSDAYFEVLPYDTDKSALNAAIKATDYFIEKDYSAESYSDLKTIYDLGCSVVDDDVSQTEIDNTVCALLEAQYKLTPYLNLKIDSVNGSIINSANSNSILYGTEVSLTANPNEGYRFAGWYEKTSQRVLSTDIEYTFAISTNIDIEARFVPITSAMLTFVNPSGQIVSTIVKTVDEWNDVKDVTEVAPRVPYSYGNTNGRWDCKENTLDQLKAGNDVTITAVYDIVNKTEIDELINISDTEPVASLRFDYNEDAGQGSFIMSANIPEKCRLNSVGVAFYQSKKDSFNPSEMLLTLNNKNIISQFNTDEKENIYIINTSTTGRRWAAVGYITYFNEDGKLITYYTNQVNVINNQWIR